MWLSSVESTECLMTDRKQTWGFLLASLTEGYCHLGLAAALLPGINHHNHIYTCRLLGSPGHAGDQVKFKCVFFLSERKPQTFYQTLLSRLKNKNKEKWREWEGDGQQKGRHSNCQKYCVVGIAAWRSRPGHQTWLELWKQLNSSSLSTSAGQSSLR